MRSLIAAAAGALVLAGCGNPGDSGTEQAATRNISVRSPEQAGLHELNALNRSIALKRAIHDSGYPCKRITESGFVGTYKNLEMWTASCSDRRDWAIFIGPDGSAQVRYCKDVQEFGLPGCKITSKRADGGDLPSAE
ncbi:hypothetical protein H8M03_08345 [Sphingomonas sabuli]|uniref:Uncharacterized protein n=1 Tax=Sphingomonas sabuli TaxID=2764186 RepID=A0A7G9L093_9SPHN|nr:hypothetical protein [Sphingomonas sabuli]QNM82042.1 hypothetical protein H8M03_08345 [Sphingomonas sabuli]